MQPFVQIQRGRLLRLVIFIPLGNHGSITIEPRSTWPISKVIELACKILNIKSKNVMLTHEGRRLNEDVIIGNFLNNKQNVFCLTPQEISACVDESALMEEYQYLRQQFPLVRMEDLLTYKGRIRCERGYVKELADRGVWPFTEYVQWHEFKMALSYLHPFKPPTVTWLTDISHPNIIPKKKGKVCVSLLGKKWLPNTKLAAVVNALYFLLSDPNPYSAYPNKRCKEVAKICRMFGFPLKRRQIVKIIPQKNGI